MLRVDADGLARRKRGEYLDLLVRVDGAAAVAPSLAERMRTVLRDARQAFPQRHVDLDGPVPWSDAVWAQIDFRGPRRAELADLVTFIARHPAWEGLDGELVRAPSQSYGGDKPWIRGLTGGLHLAGRDLVSMAEYPPADTPPNLVAELLEWADIERAARVWISTWNLDRRVAPSQVMEELEAALAWTSNMAVASFDHGIFRRVVFNRDCILATVSCRDDKDPRPEDAERRRAEADRFADLFWHCRHGLSFAAVNPSGMNLLTWAGFLSLGANPPPHSSHWDDVADSPPGLVPDAYALQLLTPAHRRITLGPDWDEQTTEDGYRIVKARDLEPWLDDTSPRLEELYATGPPPWRVARPPRPEVLAAARAELDSIIDHFGRTALHDAARNNDVVEVQRLLAAGASPDAADRGGLTPLHFAAESGAAEAAGALLAAGAEVDPVDRHGDTPLMKAVYAYRGDGALIGLLRTAGADPDVPNSHGYTPVSWARLLTEHDVAQFFADLP